MISIIIPVYNVEEYLSRCIDSVLNQTHKNLEIILVDDGSADNCGKICDEYAQKDSRIKVIHKENGGVSSARNAGLDIAQGDYVAFVDADDYVEKEMCEYLLKEMESGEFDIIQYNYCDVLEDGTLVSANIKNRTYDNYNDILYDAFTRNIHFGITKFYRRDVVKNIRYRTDLSRAEDMLFFLECAKKTARLKTTDKILYYYFQRETSVTHKPVYFCIFDILKVLDIIKDDCNNERTLAVVNYYYFNKCVDAFLSMVADNIEHSKCEEIRKKIIEGRKEVLFFTPITTSRGVVGFSAKTKLNVFLIWLCPVLLYKIYPNYLQYRKGHSR